MDVCYATKVSTGPYRSLSYLCETVCPTKLEFAQTNTSFGWKMSDARLLFQALVYYLKHTYGYCTKRTSTYQLPLFGRQLDIMI